MYYIHSSFWAETVGGMLVRRLKSKKNPAVSVMNDYLRQECLNQQRLLKPHLFGKTKAQQQAIERVTTKPLYINKFPEVVVKRSNQVNVSLSRLQQTELKIFAKERDLDVGSTSVLEFYRSLTFNGIMVRTKDSEATLKTRDSIVCGRFHGARVDDDDSKDIPDQLIFGQVLLIAKLNDDVLCNVNWFQTKSDVVFPNERNGLEPVRVLIGRTRQMNDWMFASTLAFQRHIIIGELRNRNICHIICKD